MTAGKTSFTCPHCRAKFAIGPKHFGRSGKCSNCDGVVTFPDPAGKGSGAKVEKKIKIACEQCGARLTLGVKSVGKKVKCPKCKQPTLVDKAKAKLVKKKRKGELDLKKDTSRGKEPGLLSDQDRKAFNAWEVMQKSKEDSYWVALWRAFLYPWEAMGAVVFFVVGVPVGLLLVELFAKWALKWSGHIIDDEASKVYAAGIILVIALFAAVSCVSFFCSFLFAVVRTSAEGREAIPVIEGMHHRSNLAAMLAWVVIYLGPGLFLGFNQAEEGELFTWNPPALVAFGGLLLLAPMGFMLSATVNAVAGLNPVDVFKGIGSIFSRYAYLLMVLMVSAGLFIMLGIWAGGEATVRLSAEEPDYAIGIPLRILSGLLYMFPLVIFSRTTGLVVKYWQDYLPFEVDLQSEYKASLLPQIVAFAGLIMLFLPLFDGAKAYQKSGGIMLRCEDHLNRIYWERFRYDGDRCQYPANYAALEKLVGKGDLKCPAKEFEHIVPFYAIYENLGRSQARSMPRLLWIYETKSLDPDPNLKRINTLLLNGTVTNFTSAKLEKLLAIQKRITKEDDRLRRENLYSEFITEMQGFKSAE